jgi:23S rRNA (uracil1939-C5)-methyltransferase
VVKTARATVPIESIAAGGAGVGRLPDGRAVFVQRTAPGDVAFIELIADKKRYARGRLLKVVTEGPNRRKAPCPHYSRCGGCTLEHLEYSAQTAAKARIVSDALQRIGRLGVSTPDVTPSPREFQYRNRVSFTLVRTPGGRVLAGFHEIDRPERVVDISASCLLPEPAIADAWGQLRSNWGEQASLLPSGDELRLTLRANTAGEVTLVIDGGYSRGQPDVLLERAPLIKALWHRPGSTGAHSLLAGESTVEETWNEEDIELSGSVFLQVNRAAAELLEEHVLELARARPPGKVIDAYCGIGLHARRLARLGAEVIGIELDATAVDQAQRAGLPGCTFIAARVEDVIEDHLPADLLIVNPPRAGLAAEITNALLNRRADRIVYVSCDPATLARDLARLAAAYNLTSTRCFDLFPQTSHVETVVELTCVTS